MPLLLHRAFKIAQEPPSGPVFMALPLDVMEQEGIAVSDGATVYPGASGSGRYGKSCSVLVGSQESGDCLWGWCVPFWRTARAGGGCGTGRRSGLEHAVDFGGQLSMAHPQFRGELTDNHARIRQLLNEPDAVLYW
jgi:benzoylformate decarboxylase